MIRVLVPLLALGGCIDLEPLLQVLVSDLVVPEVHRAEVRVSSGHVHVRAGETYRLETVRRFSGEEPPEVHAEVASGLLQVRVDCPDDDVHCSVDVDLTLPADAVTQLVTGAGDVTVEGMAGAVFADTRAGVVDLFDLTGPVEVRTASGDVVAVDLASADVEVRADAGDVDLSFALAPERLWVDLDAGRVDVSLPLDAYVLDLLAIGGDVHIADLEPVDDAPHHVIATTRQGDITIRAR